MDPSSWHCFRYMLPLTEPLVLKGQTIQSRTGLILKSSEAKDGLGVGECAPLPGFSRETLEDVLAGSQPLLPSLCFARDMAMASLIPTCSRIPVNGLVIADATEQAVAQARAYGERHYQAIKLKVGRQAVQEDIARVQAVSHVLKDRCALRLDANRAWDYSTACHFAHAVKGCPVAYLEEPLTEPSRLGDFVADTAIPVALDESLCENNLWEPLIRSGQMAAIVVKPTLIGGLDRIRFMVNLARESNTAIVLSACFESGVGVALLARLAASFPDAVSTPVGLDTYRWLAEDILTTRLSMEDGYLDLTVTEQSLATLNWDRLEQLDDA